MTGNSDVELEDAEKLPHSSETGTQDSAKEILETKLDNTAGGEAVNKEDGVTLQNQEEDQSIPMNEDNDLPSEEVITRSENEELNGIEYELREAEDEQNNATNGVTERNSVGDDVVQEEMPNENGTEAIEPDRTVDEKPNDEGLKKSSVEIGGEDTDRGAKIAGSDETVENVDATESRQLPANEAPPSQVDVPNDVPRGEDAHMEDTSDPNEKYTTKDKVIAIEEAATTHASPRTNGNPVTLEPPAKLGSEDSSILNQFESVTPGSLAINTAIVDGNRSSVSSQPIALMVEDGDGTLEDQEAFMTELESFYRQKAIEFKPPKFYGQPLNCLKLWRAVIRLGGYDRVTGAKLWRQVGESFHPPKTCTTVSWTFRIFYEKSLLEYEKHKIRSGELQFGAETLPEATGIDIEGNGFQGSVPGRARRDAAARAMQGWHSQRNFGYGEVAEPVIKDKNANSIAKRDKNLKAIGSVKQKRPNELEHSIKALRTETSRQLVTSVIDIGPPAEWVKVNVLQAKDCFEVYALVPGLLREEVRVQSDPAGRLVITGQPEQIDNPWGVTAFKKVINLPRRIDPLGTSAVVSLHGGLFVHVPFEQPDSLDGH